MKVTIDRSEPTTGGPSRTPRDHIEPVFTEHTGEVEPDMLFDCSSSEGWEWDNAPGTTTWGIQLPAIREFVAGAEQLDSQAAAEQAGGDDEKGGIYAAGFGSGVYVVGEGDDDGDLNSANIEKKLNAMRVRDDSGTMVPLPWGGTYIMSACELLDEHYLGEFGNRPVSQRPIRARVVWTDGALNDADKFGQRLAADNSDKWPEEHWFVAILGYGPDHDRTLRAYQQISEKHSNVHVYAFDQVSNPAEVAEDMAVAVLGRK
jgi:hypothetical protein